MSETPNKHEFKPNRVEPTWCAVCGFPYDEYNLHPRPDHNAREADQQTIAELRKTVADTEVAFYLTVTRAEQAEDRETELRKALEAAEATDLWAVLRIGPLGFDAKSWPPTLRLYSEKPNPRVTGEGQVLLFKLEASDTSTAFAAAIRDGRFAADFGEQALAAITATEEGA